MSNFLSPHIDYVSFGIAILLESSIFFYFFYFFAQETDYVGVVNNMHAY